MSLKQSNNIVNMIDYVTEEKASVTQFFILMEYCSSKLYFQNSYFLYFTKILIDRNSIEIMHIYLNAKNIL